MPFYGKLNKIMDLPKLQDLDIAGKKVLLRLDLDTIPDPNDLRIKSSFETLDYLKEKNAAEIIILAHKGRPQQDGVSVRVREELSLKPFQSIFDKWGARVEGNLRFDPGEESNDPEFAKKLALKGEAFINEAFGSSHREHASIVGLPRLCKSKCKGKKCVAVGFHFQKEIENLSKVIENPERPLVILLSGIKKDKLEMIEPLSKLADKVLVGGRLPDYMGDEALVSVRVRGENEKVIVGNLNMDKEDITLNTIERFEKEIEKAKTVVLAGVLGKYEDPGHRQGTQRVFRAVADSSAFKIAGGGDTLNVISQMNLGDKFDWISVGGGAMIEYITKKTLPGIEALKV